MRQLWFVYYNSERNLVVRMKISKNRHKFWVVKPDGSGLRLESGWYGETYGGRHVSNPF